LSGSQVRIGGGDIAPSGFDAAVDATEQVQFVADIKTDIDGPVLAASARRSLPLWKAAILSASSRHRLRSAFGAHLAQGRTGAGKPRHGNAQIGVRG
jgi:hypothetical protein